MSTAIERFDEGARRRVGEHGRTVVYEGELLRHPVYTRVLHWSVATFLLLALLSGFAIYSPWLFLWLTPLFGGGPRTRLLHPCVSIAFVAVFALRFELAAADDVERRRQPVDAPPPANTSRTPTRSGRVCRFLQRRPEGVSGAIVRERDPVPDVGHPDVVSRGRSARILVSISYVLHDSPQS